MRNLMTRISIGVKWSRSIFVEMNVAPQTITVHNATRCPIEAFPSISPPSGNLYIAVFGRNAFPGPF